MIDRRGQRSGGARSGASGRVGGLAAVGILALAASALAGLSGCASEDKLVTPTEHRSPWGAERTWALVPLANESGVSTIDTLTLSDQFVAEVEAVEGIRCIPLNRSIAGMRALGLNAIRTDAEARGLMRVLQVDGLVVGSITAYDPYQPLTLGMAAQLYTSDQPEPAATNVAELTMAVTERGPADRSKAGPSSQASRIYAANNHEVLQRLARYAAGRNNPKSGLREQIYTSSMNAYSRFVAFETVGELLNAESARQAERMEVAEGGTTGRQERAGG